MPALASAPASEPFTSGTPPSRSWSGRASRTPGMAPSAARLSALAVLACWGLAPQQAVPALPAAYTGHGRAPPPWHAADRPAAMAARGAGPARGDAATSRGCGRGMYVAMRCLRLRGGVEEWPSWSSSAVSAPTLGPGEHWPSDFSSDEVDPETGLKGDVPPGCVLPRRFSDYSSERRSRVV